MTPDSPDDIEPREVRLRTTKVVRIGIVLWALVLVVMLLVPSLRQGPRDWWVWVPVSGIGLGLIGLAYLHRGRGNASDAT